MRFRVTADEDEEIHVHGYDIEKEVPAGETIDVSFPATITGIFEIEFHAQRGADRLAARRSRLTRRRSVVVRQRTLEVPFGLVR